MHHLRKLIFLFFPLVKGILVFGQTNTFSENLSVSYGAGCKILHTTQNKIVVASFDSLLVVTQFDIFGNIEWTQRIMSATFTLGPNFGLEEDREGNYLFLCSRFPSSGGGVSELFKFSPLGNLIWSKMYSNAGANQLNDVKVLPDTGFVIVGGGCSGSVITIRCDKNANILWQRFYSLNVSGMSTANSFVFANAQNNIVSFCQFNQNGNSYLMLMKTNCSTGNMLWAKSFAVPGYLNYCKKITSVGDGYVMCGELEDSASLSISYSYFFKTDTTGNLIWFRIYNEGNNGFSNTVVLLPDSGFMLGGAIFIPGSNVEEYLLRVDKNGHPLSSISTGNPDWLNQNYYDDVTDMTVVNNSEIFYTGGNLTYLGACDFTPYSFCQHGTNATLEINPIVNVGNVSGTPFNSNFSITNDLFQTQQSGFAILDKCFTTNSNSTDFSKNEISIFPNPSSQKTISVSSSEKITKVEIYDVNGRKIADVKPDLEGKISVPENSGIYFLNFYSGEKFLGVKKFVKTE